MPHRSPANSKGLGPPSQLEVVLFWIVGTVVTIASGGVAIYADHYHLWHWWERGNSSLSFAIAHHARSIGLGLPEELRQPRDVYGDPSRLVLRQYLRLPRLVLVVAGVDVRKGLPVGVAYDVTAG
jgi:hypothetical protein